MGKSTMNPLESLDASLIEVAQRHLREDEKVLTALYLNSDDHLGGEEQSEGEVRLPARAFVLTQHRILLLESPLDAVSVADQRGHLIGACLLDQIIALELRSHLLDCALTCVAAVAGTPARLTIGYNGLNEPEFHAAVATIRSLMEGQFPPQDARVTQPSVPEQGAVSPEWRQALAGLEFKQERAVERYLAPDELVEAWLSVPAIDEANWWEHLEGALNEQPPAILVRTERQILLVKETRRMSQDDASFGTDAWLLPRGHIRNARLSPGRHEHEVSLKIRLEHAGATYEVRLPLPIALGERARALVSTGGLS